MSAPKVVTEFAHAGDKPPQVAGISVDGRKVYHVLHEREGYPLSFWFTYNPELVQSGWRCHPEHFDIRDCRELFRVTTTERAANAAQHLGANLAQGLCGHA